MPEVPGQTNQTVLYFNTESAAHIKFERYKETDLPETVDPDTVQTPSTVFLQPPEIVYRSPLADEQYLGCGVSVVPTCRAGLRYGNYFVYFHFDLRASYYAHYLDESVADEMLYEGGLSLSEVERVLQAMDEHYVELFDLQLPGADTE